MANIISRSRGSYSLTIDGETDDPAQNEKLVEWLKALDGKLRGVDYPQSGAMSGGTAFEGREACPVALHLTAVYTNDNGEAFRVELDGPALRALAVTGPLGNIG